MGNCLSFGSSDTDILWKLFSLDKATQHVYIKFTVRAAPLSGSEPDTVVSVRDKNRTLTYGYSVTHTTPNDFSPYVFNRDIDLGQVLPQGAVVAICFSTTGAGPEPWAQCVNDIYASTDPIT